MAQWQAHNKAASRPVCIIFCPDSPIVKLYYGARKVQANTRAFAKVACGILRLVKALKNLLQFTFVNTNAAIGNNDFEKLLQLISGIFVFTSVEMDINFSIFGCVLYCIAN